MSADLHILQHSLGVDQYGRGEPYRNHFCTGEGSVDHPICNDLVERGLMLVRRNVAVYGGDDVFFVTDEGRAWMLANSPQPPKLTRSQKRYRDYCDADSGLSFGEWLRVRPSEELAW